MFMRGNRELEDLLYLDGMIMHQDLGCWVKVEVKRARKITGERPHGIKYSLTLHAPDGTRLLGFDNAHSVGVKKDKHNAAKCIAYDHRHCLITNKIYSYEFTSPGQLLVDFWVEVDKTLEEYREFV